MFPKCLENHLEFNKYLKYTRTLALEGAMAPHSSTLAWKIPSTEEPGRLQSMGSLRVGHSLKELNMTEEVEMMEEGLCCVYVCLKII